MAQLQSMMLLTETMDQHPDNLQEDLYLPNNVLHFEQVKDTTTDHQLIDTDHLQEVNKTADSHSWMTETDLKSTKTLTETNWDIIY